MAAAELTYEYFMLALESTRGTAIAAPTHYLPLKGSLKPVRTKYRPEESRGTLAKNYRSKTTRTLGEWSAEGGLDPNYAAVFFNLIAKANATPTTPTNGVLTRLWTYTPTMTSDDLKSATFFFGDPGVQIWRAAYGMADEMTVTADTTGTDPVMMSINGISNFPARFAAPSLPAMAVGDMLMPGAMQMWMDTGATAIGTTEVTGRFVSTEWTIPTGNTYKYYAAGPTTTLGYTATGRTSRAASATIVVELNTTSIAATKEFLTWEADTTAKVRIRLNGSLIESVTPTYYQYVQLDIYGPLDALEWGDVEGSNRTMAFTIESQYDSTLGADFSLSVQNTLTAL